MRKYASILMSLFTVCASSCLSAQEVMREGLMEKMVLFGPESGKEWSVAEAQMESSAEHVKVGKAALHWHVTIDFTSGETGYPIGWPRTNHAIPEGPRRDWSSWDFLHLWVYTDTSRDALPKEPAGLILYTPDRAGEYHRILSELKKGQWVEITIPLAQVPRDNDVRLLQFYLSEANYRDRDQVDFYIDDLALLRYAEPTLLDFAAERAVMFSDTRNVPVRFQLAGVKPGENAEVTCEFRRDGRVLARASARVQRGPQRLVLDLGNKALEPGAYDLTAHVNGSQQAATARVRVVESPWVTAK